MFAMTKSSARLRTGQRHSGSTVRGQGPHATPAGARDTAVDRTARHMATIPDTVASGSAARPGMLSAQGLKQRQELAGVPVIGGFANWEATQARRRWRLPLSCRWLPSR
jgi:hypothetical protein